VPHCTGLGAEAWQQRFWREIIPPADAMSEPEPEPASGPDPRVKAARAEFDKLKAKYGDQVTFAKGPKGSPWPVTVTRKIPQPANAVAWDVHELVIAMVIDHPDPDQGLVHVDVPMENFPPVLQAKISDGVTRKWKATLKDPRAAGKGWLFSMIFADCEKKFLTLIGLVPELVENYQAVKEDGSTYRRFTISHIVVSTAAHLWPESQRAVHFCACVPPVCIFTVCCAQEATEETEEERLEREEEALRAEAIWMERRIREEEEEVLVSSLLHINSYT
jgi:hypothetical protein